jgi:hypothetical protein
MAITIDGEPRCQSLAYDAAPCAMRMFLPWRGGLWDRTSSAGAYCQRICMIEVAGTVFISQPERDESDVLPAKEVSDTMIWIDGACGSIKACQN